VVRNPEKLDALVKAHEQQQQQQQQQRAGSLRVVKGNVHSKEDLAKEMPGIDAVLIALGPTAPPHQPDDLIRAAVEASIAAMQQHSVIRIVIISAGPVREVNDARQSWFSHYVLMPLLWYFLRFVYEDMMRAEDLLMKQDAHHQAINWTIIRPSYLTTGAIGQYKVVQPWELNFFSKISRASLAHFMLKCVVEEQHVNETVYLTE
jgi:putative NADH-flavin reductase